MSKNKTSLVCAAVLLCGSVACAGILTLSGMPTIDPSRMINCNGRYYVYSTGQLAQSSVDRIHWMNDVSPFDNWPSPNGTPPSVYSLLGADNTGNWAPDVIFLNNKYYLYYSVANLNTRDDVTALLTSPTLDPSAPDYGWTDVGVVVQHNSVADLRSAIDPCPFLDTSNNLWLCYGSGYGAGVTSGTDSIFMRRLDNTTGLASSTDTTEYPVVKGRVEGPYVHYRAGYYYLFWNVDGNDTRYNIRVARSASVTGPYVNKAGTQNASESFLAATIYKNSINGNERGPGHVGILSEGGIDRLTYNFVNTSGSKVLGEQTLLWGPDGWPIAGADLAPGTYKISSLNSGLAVGVYQAGTTNGTPLDQETYTGSTFQQWTVSYTTNGSAADGYYRLTSPGSGSVAELFQANIDNGTLIDQGVWSNGNHQRWFIEQTSEGYYRMVSAMSQKVIEVPGFSITSGTSLAQMDWNNSVNQQWIIGTTSGTPPATPAGLAATSGNGQVALTWTTVAGATAYNVKRGTLQGGPATTSVGSPTAASFTDRSVTNDIIYYYTIAAVNASGISTQSAPAAAKPQVPPVVTETDSSLTGGGFAPLTGNNLILGNSGASTLSITAASDGTGVASTLTDGNLSAPASSGPLGIESGAITYNLGFGANGIGYTITGLRSLTAWGDSGRINPKYTVSYSLDGVNFTTFATVNYTATAGANGTDVALGVTGLSNVQSLRFSFPNTQQNIWVSYAELAVFGKSSGVMPTQTALDTSAPYSTFGASVTFTASVKTNGVTAGGATGTILFQVDGADASTNTLAGGSASYATTGLALGTHTVTAFYSGDADYAASTNSLVQTVEALIDPGTYNRVPYRENFETNALGSTLSGVKGWYGAAEAALIETNRFAPAVTGGYPLAGPHTQSLTFSGSVSNLLGETSALTNICVDLLMTFQAEAGEPPVLPPACQLAFWVNSSRRMLVWHGQAGSSNRWTELPDVTVSADAFVRMTVQADYARDPQGSFGYRLWVNRVPVTRPSDRFATACADRNYLRRLALAGTGQVDDLAVEPYNTMLYRRITAAAGPHGRVVPAGDLLVPVGASTNIAILPDPFYAISAITVDGLATVIATSYAFTNVADDHALSADFAARLTASGVPEFWLNRLNPAWTDDFEAHALADSDGDGVPNGSEYVAGTDASSTQSVFRLQFGTSNGLFAVTFPTVPEGGFYGLGGLRRYALEQTDDLAAIDWQAVPGLGAVAGAGQNVSYTNRLDGAGRRFFRGRVWLEP